VNDVLRKYAQLSINGGNHCGQSVGICETVLKANHFHGQPKNPREMPAEQRIENFMSFFDSAALW
jgi:hypothetical protein